MKFIFKASLRQLSAVAAMLTFACLFLTGCANSNMATSTETVANKPPSELIGFYAVPFRCPAAPGIGCGSRAKPILLELERVSGIKEAWLNRQGTQLAVMWSDGIRSQARKEALQTVLERDDLTATELSRSERAKALKGFQSGTGWYRAAAVDRLSEEEAGIIAARLVGRVHAKTPLTEPKGATLRKALADTLIERFTGPPERAARSQEEERDDFLKKAAGYLNERELVSLSDAFASGLRPLAGEQ